MWKALLITALAFYVFYKITSFFFKAGAASQRFKQQDQQSRFDNKKNKQNGTNIKGGDYVDYEEVK